MRSMTVASLPPIVRFRRVPKISAILSWAFSPRTCPVDNKLALNAGWDLEMLALEIGELGEAGFDLSLTGFDEFELGELFAGRTQGRTDPDDAPEPPAHPVAEPGDLWVLGRHQLLCGDSTVATDVERVLGGVAPHLMVTDPPYGVSYDPQTVRLDQNRRRYFGETQPLPCTIRSGNCPTRHPLVAGHASSQGR